MQGAAKVGALVIVFVVLLYGAFMVLGKDLFGKPQVEYYAAFHDAGGVTAGSPVQMAGVKIGTVDGVKLVSPTLAKMTLKIGAEFKLPEGSTAVIPTALIGLGDKAVVIMPPDTSNRTNTTYLSPGATLNGTKAGALDNILPNPQATVNELNKTLAAARKLLENQKLQDKLVALLDSSNKTAQHFGNLAARMDMVLAQSNPKIQNALTSASATMAEVQKGTAMLTQILKEGKFQKQALAMLDKLNKAAEGATQIMADVHALTSDPQLKDSLTKTANNVATMTDSGTRIAQSAEKIAKDGEKISANAIVMSEKAVEIETKASALLDEVQKAVENIKGFFQKGGGKVSIPKVETNIDLIRETEPNEFRTDITATIDVKNYKIDVGLWDAFESNKLIAQIGKPFSANGKYRYGIYASKPGIGVDYRVAPGFYLRGDLFDINNPRFDLRARYEFGKGFYGWIGVSSVFDKNAPIIGFGIRN